MIKLNTHLPLEVVKKSEKLLKLKPEKYFFRESPMAITDTRFKSESNFWNLTPAPKIADIIDNAEELFGNHFHDGGFNTCGANYKCKSEAILWKCMNNKSIEEISSYILSNIK